MTAPLSRSEAVKKLTSRPRLAGPGKDGFSEELFRRIKEGKVIPIISNAFRLEHIFRGLLGTDEANCPTANGAFLNVDNILSQAWAQELDYPLADACELARIAQYNRIKAEDDERAKVIYLTFLKNALLSFADNNNNAPTGLLVELQSCIAETSFTDLARELNIPQFGDQKDPLQILVELPLLIYVTTSFHEFIEDALLQCGKKPVSQVCFWSGNTPGLEAGHEILKDYIPTVDRPLVYHLYGLDRYPTSLVISEDDYLDYLAKITHDLDTQHPILPMFVRSALSTSSLIMLGYRLWEWDFRILFRGILNAPSRPNWINLIIQLTPEQQYQIHDANEARRYLETYFNPAHFKVEWNSPELFLYRLWDEWNHWRIG